MSGGTRNFLALTQDEDDEMVVTEYRGLACLIVRTDAGAWTAEKIVADARAGIEWILPELPFPSVAEAVQYVQRIIDAAFPREKFGDEGARVE